LSRKKRIQVTMPKLYVDSLDRLVEEGAYPSRGEAILDAVRTLLEKYGRPHVTR